VRYSIYLVLPLVLVLMVFGGEVMRIWMGPNYVNWILPAILAVGFLGTCIQTPIFSMLSGLNLHGRGALGQLVGAAISSGCAFVAINILNAGLTGAAVAVTLPLLFVNLVYLPALLCERLGQKLSDFYRDVAVPPLRRVLPFVVCLAIGRLLFKPHLFLACAVCATGSIFLACSYWKSVLPERVKLTMARKFEKAARPFGFRLDVFPPS
jgi:O-antigen/teichoic acid export membrane protein